MASTGCPGGKVTVAISLVLAACSGPLAPDTRSLPLPHTVVGLLRTALTLVLPPPSSRRTLALPAPAGFKVTISAADLAVPVSASIASASAAATLVVPNVPAGMNRIIAVQGLDQGGQPIANLSWLAVATLGAQPTQVALSPATTAVGWVWKRWLTQGRSDLATSQEPAAVAGALGAVVSANHLPSYALIDVNGFADAVANQGKLDVGNAFALEPGLADITLRGVPDNSLATVFVDDPASPVQTGLAPITSQSEGRYRSGPILPGHWTVWAQVPELGTATGAIDVTAGQVASTSIDFPGWVAGPDLPQAIGDAAVVSDGRIITVIGGVLDSGQATDSCWQLDTASPQPKWTSTLPRLPVAREGAAAALVGSRVFVVGGHSNDGYLTDAYSLDLSPGAAWGPLPAGAAPRSVYRHPVVPLGAFADGNTVIVAWAIPNELALPPYAGFHFQRYSPSTSGWESDPGDLPPMAVPRANAGVATFAGSWVVAGGDRELISEGAATGLTGLLALATVESLVQGRWSAWPDLPTPRSALALAQGGNFLYAAGGVDAQNRPVNAVERFDPNFRRWAVAPPLRTARSSFGLAFAGGRLWAIGGAPSLGAEDFAGVDVTGIGGVGAVALSSVESLAVDQ